MDTTTYSKDDWDNGATTNSKVTRTMGNWEQWDAATYSKRLNQLHCLQVHQIRSHNQNSITTVTCSHARKYLSNMYPNILWNISMLLTW